jgi:hypothetical protein
MELHGYVEKGFALLVLDALRCIDLAAVEPDYVDLLAMAEVPSGTSPC